MADWEGTSQMQARGLKLMDPDLAVAALAQVIDGDEATVAVADVDWARFAGPFTLRRPSPLLAGLPEVATALAGEHTDDGDQSPAGTALARRIAGLSASEQQRVLTGLVQAEAAAVLGHSSPDAVEPDRFFRDLGFDSLTAIELRNKLTAATGAHLPATLIYDYPTPALLSGYLHAKTIHREAAQQPVLKEIENLESALSRVTGNNDERSKILTRLEALVQDFRTGTTESVSAYQEIDSATDEEMFSLIDKELGI
jgi:acyl carrier protein